MKTLRHSVSNGAGWRLSLTQTFDEDKLNKDLMPLVIVPGYGMNSFIFGFHPNGVSLEGHLCGAGFEVWRADLRAQGESNPSEGGSDDFSLADLALTDLGAAIDAVLAHTVTSAKRVSVLGASLGGSLMFAHAVVNPKHRMGALVSMGGPVRWEKIHPLVRVAFASATLVGLIRFKGTRKLAETALPYLARLTPWLLKVYMNPEITDIGAAREMVKTVEDPNRHINREIAGWIKGRDLVVRGVNVSLGLPAITQPLLCIAAHGDGVVPLETAEYPFRKVGSASKELIIVGDPGLHMAHADMFVSSEAHERVFRPMTAWLLENGRA
ncbi:MAG: alpha/beta fold hydrolase [Myxococcaceae bacterium]